MADWFESWFDEDYADLYAHRDGREAEDAVALALRLLPELARGPVLDLGCGAGRHLEVLRRVNPEAFGLDLSPALLRLAPPSLKPHLLRGDMRQLPFRSGGLAGITLWFTPFGYFDDTGNRALLHDLSDLLRPGGVLLLDYLNAAHLRRSLVPEDVAERAGIRVESRRAITGDRIRKDMVLTRLDTGERREAHESVHLYTPEELESSLADAGLKLRAVAGDYAGGAFTDQSPRWIGMAAKV